MTHEDVVEKILSWYKKNKRDLPWRRTRDPYKILISEVMLQQTQVDRVVPKYTQFLHAFPTVRALANAKTADVIRAWQGLGYNRRALFLRKAAIAVAEKYHGNFPRNPALLKELPGIGDYTARAILSFAFLLPVAVLDTNHRKFYPRTFFGKKQKTDMQLLEKAEAVVATLDPKVVCVWNNALMDLMSAVARHSPVIVWYEQLYPRHQKNKKSEKEIHAKNVPFKQTDRYFRGRTIEFLREKHFITYFALQKKFAQIPGKRLDAIVAGLLKDGLIKRQGRRILLP